MSVINKMLKDLDKRQQPHGIERIETTQGMILPEQKSKLPMLAASVLSLIVGGLIVFFVSNPKSFSLHESADTTQQKSTNATVSTPQAQPASKAQEAQAGSGQDGQNDNVTQINHQRNTVVDNNVAAEPVQQVPVAVTQGGQAKPAVEPAPEPHVTNKVAVKEVKLTPKQLALKQMILAHDAKHAGLPDEALAYYEAALAYNPALHQARRQIASLYYGQNKLSEAEHILKQGQLLFPQEYEFYLLLARIQQALGDNQQALLSLKKIPDSSDIAIQKWQQQSELAQKEQDFPTVENSFRLLAQAEPNRGRWWLGLGYALDSQKNYTEANEAYQQALAQGDLSSKAQAYVDNRLVQLGAFQ
ncbi:tetratricopeptide repeat protein [Shewanella youngdeokensis]|uniref:Tetratricopeptide repeat protein n=1 Tax=Shewanella youngdeokensis TaxID=2999068 RepID=A0ABZ0JY65_9GAMM|nr:tetratricopeptide repeat protein [Shewanella sp. DAU334]